ncbi:hypothetical protein JHK87_012369 [Glycine soja]|nr:hypothetical protein JHK87_012369 [Glycine soja]
MDLFFIYTLAISLCACSSPLLFTYLTPVPLLFYSHTSIYSSPLVEFLVSKIPISHNLFTESISACIKPQLTRFFKPAMECGSANVVTDLLHADADVTATVECLMPLAIRVRSLHMVKLLEAFDCKIDESVLHKTVDIRETLSLFMELQTLGDRTLKKLAFNHVVHSIRCLRVVSFYLSLRIMIATLSFLLNYEKIEDDDDSAPSRVPPAPHTLTQPRHPQPHAHAAATTSGSRDNLRQRRTSTNGGDELRQRRICHERRPAARSSRGEDEAVVAKKKKASRRRRRRRF